MQLSIVIVNWNTRQLLEGCLSSIYANAVANMEVFVIDNASSDKSAEMAVSKFPQAALIKNTKNIGFAKANNQAIRQAQGEYILILNSDTIILENALQNALELLEKNPQIAILGPKTLNNNHSIQKTIRRDPGLLSQLFFPSKIRQLFPNWKPIKNYYFDGFDYEKSSLVEQLQGSCLFIRKKVFENIGLFDEKFFIWFEEVDFCLRARHAGYKLLYSPNVKIIHYGGESFSQLNTLKKQALYSRSLLYYFWKNKPKWQWLILFLSKMPVMVLNKIIK